MQSRPPVEGMLLASVARPVILRAIVFVGAPGISVRLVDPVTEVPSQVADTAVVALQAGTEGAGQGKAETSSECARVCVCVCVCVRARVRLTETGLCE